mmetsp:Transcript_27938/g.60823  ORF Transcript_27938/g.60823 Transcript_27938/m.60823 type:complete len:773 (+) Transcript_27938:69-2387(+)
MDCSASLPMMMLALMLLPIATPWTLGRPQNFHREECKPIEQNIHRSRNQQHALPRIGTAAATCAAAAAIFLASAMPAPAIEASIVEGQLPALNPAQRRYATILATGTPEEVSAANEALLDHAVGTINTMYYDNSGGNNFDTRRMYARWGALRAYAKGGGEGLEEWKRAELRRVERDRADWVEISGDRGESSSSRLELPEISSLPKDAFSNRQNAVNGLNWLVSTLHDPYSRYLTKEQLFQELKETSNGFVGTGALVQAPMRAPDTLKLNVGEDDTYRYHHPSTTTSPTQILKRVSRKIPPLLGISDVIDLPVVTAVTANSIAERAGIVVGDRIVSVGKESFLGISADAVAHRLDVGRYDTGPASSARNHKRTTIAVAKPVMASGVGLGQERLLGYRVSRLNYLQQSAGLGTSAELDADSRGSSSTTLVQGGDGIVKYKLLKPSDSIFQRTAFGDNTDGEDSFSGAVGYIRLTRFSRASTAGYVKAVKELEAAGAQSYILDIRNNYGGIVQEAMLTASTLLRDPHSVLCYTLNSRGGFTPHDVEEYLVDKRFPGYFLSSEPSTVSIDQAKREDPAYFDEGASSWSPPSAYASLHEQGAKRNLHRSGTVYSSDGDDSGFQDLMTSMSRGKLDIDRISDTFLRSLRAQKKIVVLVNEGTASSAEVFAAALRDNGRSLALIGSKTYGKGLIQHTFPMPDGGGLRISVAEYLTPGLKHVTNVGSAKYDARTGELIGGGIRPDIQCRSIGIPNDTGADMCVGVALDVLDVSASIERFE